MYNLYFISNGGIPLTHIKTEKKDKLPKILESEIGKLECESENYILITPNEIPYYSVKGIGK